MTSLERVVTTLDHRIPDRVPVDLHNFLPAVRHAGLPFGEALQDGELLAQSQLICWRDFGHDMLLVENGVIAEAQACGCEAAYPADQPPDLRSHVLAGGLGRVLDLEVPDPFTTFPMNEVIKAVRILRREIGDRAFIMGRADQGPVALFAALRGYEQSIVDLQLEKTVTRETFRTWSDYSLYSGITLKGWPVMTMIRGRLVMRDGVVTAAPGHGRLVPRHATRRSRRSTGPA